MRMIFAFLIGLTATFYSTSILDSVVLGAQQDDAPGEADFYRGYYLQHASGDLSAAAEHYRRAGQLGLDKAVARQAKQALDEIGEDLAASDFATLMPADALAYVEVSNPGAHLEAIARAMGLTGPIQPQNESVSLRIDKAIAIPSDFQLSPALVRELRKFRGFATSITDVRQQGMPVSGISIIHPGDSDLLGGLMETGLQLVPGSSNIGGFPTYQIENQVWLVKTHRLFLVSDQRSLLEACLERLANGSGPSLAESDVFQSARENFGDAAVFAYVNPAGAVEKFAHLMQDEMAIARVALDLDHLEYVAASVSATEDGLSTHVGIEYAPGHNSVAYGLMRTASLQDRAMKHVPAGAAVVAGLGINPQLAAAAQVAGGRQLSGLDIGRELFANMEEVALFVLPTVADDTTEIPNIGLIVASGDPQKSARTWNELLSLPAKMKLDEGPQARDLTIDGTKAREYTFADNDVPALVLANLNDEVLVAGTREAVKAVIAAHRSGATLANDDRAAALHDSVNESTSKAFFVHVPRALELAAQLEGGGSAAEMLAVSRVLEDLSVTVVIHETDTNLDLQTRLSGLPRFETVIRTLAEMQPGYASHQSPSDQVIEQR